MDILEELSISTYEPGQTVWCFNTLDKIWKLAVILEPAPKPHSYWCEMEESNQKLRRTQLHIKPCLNMTECEEKQMLERTQMEENHAFQYTPAIKRNGSPIPTIASLPNMPSKSSDNSSTAKKTVTPSTPVESLRRSTRITKGIPPQQLVIN